MFRIIFLTIVCVVIGVTLLVGYVQPSMLPGPLQSASPQIKSGVETGLNGLKVALSRSKDAQPAVMGVKTESAKIFQEDTAGKPIHQKAMEYTQYQYCKMIVRSYEEEQSELSASPTTTTTTTPSTSPETE